MIRVVVGDSQSFKMGIVPVFAFFPIKSTSHRRLDLMPLPLFFRQRQSLQVWDDYELLLGSEHCGGGYRFVAFSATSFLSFAVASAFADAFNERSRVRY